MVQRRCRYCERFFQPSKFQPGQSVCSESGCQRRRRSDAHRRKLASDPEYRQVCQDSSRKWRARNPEYWRRRREGTNYDPAENLSAFRGADTDGNVQLTLRPVSGLKLDEIYYFTRLDAQFPWLAAAFARRPTLEARLKA